MQHYNCFPDFNGPLADIAKRLRELAAAAPVNDGTAATESSLARDGGKLECGT